MTLELQQKKLSQNLLAHYYYELAPLTNGCSKDQERNKNRKQKDIGEKSFKDKRHKFPFLFTPKRLEILQRVIHKQV